MMIMMMMIYDDEDNDDMIMMISDQGWHSYDTNVLRTMTIKVI